MRTDPTSFHALKGSREDEVLVQQCLLGSEEAWSSLIDKYKNLIFSIPVKSGFSREDATEIFQSVCLTLLRELPQLREPRALAAWLIRVTSHSCTRWTKERKLYVDIETNGKTIPGTDRLPDELLEALEREQLVRQVLAEASPACQRLIEALFLRTPPVPYEQAARTLGLAKGSMGAMRMRCLEKLRRSLEKKGFRT